MQTSPIANSSRSVDAQEIDTFSPTPLGWLIAWFMERRNPKPQPVEEPFDEHINGLA